MSFLGELSVEIGLKLLGLEYRSPQVEFCAILDHYSHIFIVCHN